MTGAQIKKVVESVIMFHGVNRTHPDLLDLAERTNVHVIKNENVKQLRPGDYARLFFDGKRYIFVYDETLTLEQKRFAIAHEFGHKFLNHAYRVCEDRGKTHNGRDPLVLLSVVIRAVTLHFLVYCLVYITVDALALLLRLGFDNVLLAFGDSEVNFVVCFFVVSLFCLPRCFAHNNTSSCICYIYYSTKRILPQVRTFNKYSAYCGQYFCRFCELKYCR